MTFEEVEDMIVEMVGWIDPTISSHFRKVTISPHTFSEMLRSLYENQRHYGSVPSSTGFQSISLQTVVGELKVEVSREVADDDVWLSNPVETYSYRGSHLDYVTEQILLRGESV